MLQKRINLAFIFLIIFSAVILCRLIYIQIIKYEYWRALAQGQQRFFVSLEGERGEIFFRDRKPLVINRNFPLVFAAPNEIKNPEETANTLSSILNLDKDLILEKIRQDNFYELIKRKLTDQEVSKIKEKNLSGIYLGQEAVRYYPFEILAAQTIGFLGGDGLGQYGIEGYYDGLLRGKEKILEKEKGPGGYLVSGDAEATENFSEKDSSEGADVVLTIDYNIQFLAEKLLKEAKENLDIEGGEIIVIDPNSGKIFALANFPNFDPNRYSEVEDLEVFQNGAIQKLFEPGSVFKPITMAAAIDQGKITPQTTYQDPGEIKIGGWPIYNYDERKYQGDITMTEVLEKSINTGAVFAQQQMNHDIFSEYIERFGFFEKTGIDLQGEVFSQNSEFKKGYEINYATAAFGQGIEMTPIQLIRAYSVIVNGGKLIRPHVVDKIIGPYTTTRTDLVNLGAEGAMSSFGVGVEIQPEIQNPSVISAKTASQLTAMLVSVVENGFAKKTKIPGYYLGGKTGTAQISWSALGIDKKGYSEKTVQSFVGFGPAFNPKFLVLVKLNNPKAKTAEYSAMPIFKEMAKYIIDLWQIPPDYE